MFHKNMWYTIKWYFIYFSILWLLFQKQILTLIDLISRFHTISAHKTVQLPAKSRWGHLIMVLFAFIDMTKQDQNTSCFSHLYISRKCLILSHQLLQYPIKIHGVKQWWVINIYLHSYHESNINISIDFDCTGTG